MRTFCVSRIIGAAFVFLNVGLAGSANASDLSVKFGHAIEKETALGKSADRIIERLSKISGVKGEAMHRVVEWPGVSTRGEIAIIQALKKNELQMAFLSDGPCSNIAPKCSLFTMPFIVNNPEQAYKLSDSDAVLKDIGSDFEKQGLHLLAVFENGWRQFYSSKELIKSPDQIKGQKLRVMQSPAYMAFATALGGSATPTAWPDVYKQTKAGIVHSFEVPVPPFFTAKLYEVNKNVTLTNHMYSVFYAVVNEQTWKALDDKKKEELKKIVWDERLKQRKENEHDNQSRIADLKKMKDMKVYTPSADELAKFKTATATVYEEFKSRYSNDVQKMVTEFRSK